MHRAIVPHLRVGDVQPLVLFFYEHFGFPLQVCPSAWIRNHANKKRMCHLVVFLVVC